jgi:hypothetical protein
MLNNLEISFDDSPCEQSSRPMYPWEKIHLVNPVFAFPLGLFNHTHVLQYFTLKKKKTKKKTRIWTTKFILCVPAVKGLFLDPFLFWTYQWSVWGVEWVGFVRKKVRQCQFLDSLATQPFHTIKVLQDTFLTRNQTSVIWITKIERASTSFSCELSAGTVQ